MQCWCYQCFRNKIHVSKYPGIEYECSELKELVACMKYFCPYHSYLQVRLGPLNPRWSSSLMFGVTAQSPEKLHLPNTAFALKRNTWVISGDSVFYNGVKVSDELALKLLLLPFSFLFFFFFFFLFFFLFLHFYSYNDRGQSF